MAAQYPNQPVQYPNQPAQYPGQPAQMPQSILPGAHHVHHTYIWLGGLQAAVIMVFAIGVSLAGSIVPMLFESAGATGPGSVVAPIVGLVVGLAFLLVVALIVGVTLLIQWWSWRHLTYEITPTEFNLYSGIFSKKRIHVPYQRIQAVNQQAGVLQRIAGVCSLKMDTAGGSANNGVRVPYVKVAEAEALRAELFRRKKVLLAGGVLDEQGNAFMPDGSVMYGSAAYAAAQASQAQWSGSAAVAPAGFGAATPTGAAMPPAFASGAPSDGSANILDAPNEIWGELRGVFAGAEQDTGAVSYETGLTNKELALAGVSGATGTVALVSVGAIATMATALEIFAPVFEDMFAAAVGADSFSVAALGPLISAFAWQMVFGGVAFGLVAWLIAVAGTLITYGGFRARRRENRIEVEHGLLQHNFHGVDIDRVQSVIIKQSLIRRLMGYCELSLGKIDSVDPQQDSTQQQSLSHQGIVVHPFVKTSRVPEILAGLAPEFADIPVEEVRPARVACRRAIVRNVFIRSVSFWGAVAVALVHLVLLWVLSSGVSLLPEDREALMFVIAYLPLYYVFALVMMVINAVRAVLWFKGSSFAYNRLFMRVTNSGFSVSSVTFPRRKIQFAYTKTNPFQRHAGVCIVAAKTAAGVGGSVESIWDIADADAEAWMEWVRPRS